MMIKYISELCLDLKRHGQTTVRDPHVALLRAYLHVGIGVNMPRLIGEYMVQSIQRRETVIC